MWSPPAGRWVRPRPGTEALPGPPRVRVVVLPTVTGVMGELEVVRIIGTTEGPGEDMVDAREERVTPRPRADEVDRITADAAAISIPVSEVPGSHGHA